MKRKMTLFSHSNSKQGWKSNRYVMSLVLILSFVSSISCSKLSGDLSRSQAKSILSKDKGGVTSVIPSQLDICNVYQGGEVRYRNDNTTLQQKRLLETLQTAGYVSLQLRDCTYYVAPTDKLRPFVYRKNQGDPLSVLIGDIEISSITGITTTELDPNGRVVDFTVKFIPNKLSKLVPMEHDDQSIFNETHHAKFRKYDDGWRLEGRYK